MRGRGGTAKGLAASGVAWLVLGSCTPFEEGEDVRELLQQSEPLASAQNGSGAEATERGDGRGLPDAWGCLSELSTPGVDSASQGGPSDLVTLRGRFHHYITQLVLGEEAEARVCNINDINCEQPLRGFQPLQSNGQFTALVPWGSSVVVEARSEGMMTQLVPVDTVLYRDIEVYSTGLLPVAAFEQFSAALGVPLNAGTAVLNFDVRDCNGQEAAGVTFETNLSTEGVAYVLSNGVPTTGVSATASDGSFGIANVPPGLVRIRAFTPEGQFFDEQSVVLRAGAITALMMRPKIYSVDEMCTVDGSEYLAGALSSVGRLFPCELL